MMTVVAERALASAADRDDEVRQGRPVSAIHGMPVVLKDNIDTAGIRTTAGSLHLADNVPAVDAEVVRRLRAAGAVVIGKASMAEFAMGAGVAQNPHFPETRNPWGLDHKIGRAHV
jgi:aspartyl-tRNA(Asn)/glutamyl-tRNA(Gln) amidotransferase subunit A